MPTEPPGTYKLSCMPEVTSLTGLLNVGFHVATRLRSYNSSPDVGSRSFGLFSSSYLDSRGSAGSCGTPRSWELP